MTFSAGLQNVSRPPGDLAAVAPPRQGSRFLRKRCQQKKPYILNPKPLTNPPSQRQRSLGALALHPRRPEDAVQEACWVWLHLRPRRMIEAEIINSKMFGALY